MTQRVAKTRRGSNLILGQMSSGTFYTVPQVVRNPEPLLAVLNCTDCHNISIDIVVILDFVN